MATCWAKVTIGDTPTFHGERKKKAPDLDSNPDARFKCPLPSCNMIFSVWKTLQEFGTHAGDQQHARELYREDLYRCEFGCMGEFTDELGRLHHDLMQMDYGCAKLGCKGLINDDSPTRMIYWADVHASNTYARSGESVKDNIHELGSASKDRRMLLDEQTEHMRALYYCGKFNEGQQPR